MEARSGLKLQTLQLKRVQVLHQPLLINFQKFHAGAPQPPSKAPKKSHERSWF
jgi:hypothetical protein